ncbi:hypothetical protein U0070_003305 [Myodes glareolus]|uniref:Uncharacterized protein n=1 Tax=Myodes glareolus TaxID=447135 RepID=A0AAW0J9Y4_MYOGA
MVVFHGTFAKLDKASSDTLTVEPYIAWGYPKLTQPQVIYKHGCGEISKKRTPLTDNPLIARSLGKYGIISVENLIPKTYTVGKSFKEANNFLVIFSTTGYFLKGLYSWNIAASRQADGILVE